MTNRNRAHRLSVARLSLTADRKLSQALRRIAYARLAYYLAEVGSFVPVPREDSKRTDTHWYTMDKVRPPDHQKPPKQAAFPDTPGRARMHSSKLVMSRLAVRIYSSKLFLSYVCRKCRAAQ